MDIVYPKLATELKSRKIKMKDVESLLGISAKSLYNKLRGKTPFTWDEVSLIRNTWFPDMYSDELFIRG